MTLSVIHNYGIAKQPHEFLPLQNSKYSPFFLSCTSLIQTDVFLQWLNIILAPFANIEQKVQENSCPLALGRASQTFLMIKITKSTFLKGKI